MVNQVVWRLFGDEIEKVVEEKLSDSVEKTMTDEKVSDIKRIMKKLKMTEQEAMDFLDIPQNKHAKYAEMLAEEMEHKKG